MIPLVDDREVFAKVWFPGVSGSLRGLGMEDADAFGLFEKTVNPIITHSEPCTPGEPDMCVVSTADSYAFQTSDFFPTAIQFSGTTAANWSGEDLAQYEFRSIARFKFRVDTAFDYQIFASVDPGDWPQYNWVGGYVQLLGPTSDLTIHYTQYGFLQTTGRLGPGEYTLEGVSVGGSDVQHINGATYSAQWIVNPVTDTLIVTQPLNQNVACGGTATFSVAAVGPPGNMTYQWMRNMVPLVNGPNVSGATSNTLTIPNACTPDAGYYSVVVTNTVSSPQLSMPSRFASLNIITAPTGIAEDPVGPASVPSLSAPSPNPFRSSTAMRYTLPQATRVRATVYNAAGARVRSLLDDERSGAGTVTWDGRTQAGAKAPAGIYFVHLDAGAIQQTKKVVLLR